MHPATGEVFDSEALTREPPENLADLLLALRERQGEIRRAESAVQGELARRLALRQRRKWVVGEYEIEQATRNSRVWDGDQLYDVLVDLVNDGVITAVEAADAVERKTVVRSREAIALQNRLVGDAADRVDDCWTWERKPSGALSVVRSLPLVSDEQH